MDRYDYVTPRRPRIIGGKGVTDRLPAIVDELAIRRALVISSPTFSATAAFSSVVDRLGSSMAGSFLKVESHSPLPVVKTAVEAARSVDCDAVISVGGGSAIDTAKGVVWYLDESAQSASIRHIAVPSTFSGAEFTNTSGITIDRLKTLHVHNRIIPDVVFFDPAVADAMPRELLSGSLLNAMDHCLEGLMSIGKSPMTDAACLHAIRLMRHAAANMDSADGLAAAQAAAALSVMDTSLLPVGLAHALAHVIGGRCRTPHGLTHGLVAAPVMRFNFTAVPRQQRMIAEAFGADTSSDSDAEAAWKAIISVQEMVSRMGAPKGLRGLGVQESDLPVLAEMVMEDRYSETNPRSVNPEAALEVLRWAWSGDIPPIDV